MRDERYIILKMLEEGKITAVEAMALLEALEENLQSETDVTENGDPVASADQGEAHDEARRAVLSSVENTEESGDGAQAAGPGDGVGTKQDDSEASTDTTRQEEEKREGEDPGSQQRAGQTASGTKDFNWSNIFPKDLGDQIRESVQTALKNMPHLTEELKENWKVVKRDIKRSLSEVRDEVNKGVSIDIGGIKRVLYRGRPTHEYVERIDGTWKEATGPIKVQLLTQNGSIAVRGWDEPHYQITVRKHVRGIPDEDEASSLAKEAVKVDKSDDGIEIVVLPKDHVSASIEAYLPREKLYHLTALTRNGGLIIEQIKSDETKAASTNGGASVKSITARRLEVRTTNGGIVSEDIDGGEVVVTTTNGGIRWQGRAERASLETTNGGVVVEPKAPQGKGELRVRTTNASLEVVLPADDSLGLRVRASGMPVEGTGTQSIAWNVQKGDIGFPRQVTGETPGFDRAERSLNLDLETTNGRVWIRNR